MQSRKPLLVKSHKIVLTHLTTLQFSKMLSLAIKWIGYSVIPGDQRLLIWQNQARQAQCRHYSATHLHYQLHTFMAQLHTFIELVSIKDSLDSTTMVGSGPRYQILSHIFARWVSKKTHWHVKIACKKHTDMPESHTKHMPLWYVNVFFDLSNMQIIYLGPLPTGQLLPLLSCHHLFCWLWCMTVFQLYFKQDTQKMWAVALVVQQPLKVLSQNFQTTIFIV